MVASIEGHKLLLRLRPYPMRGHRLLCYARAVRLKMHVSHLGLVKGLQSQVSTGHKGLIQF